MKKFISTLSILMVLFVFGFVCAEETTVKGGFEAGIGYDIVTAIENIDISSDLAVRRGGVEGILRGDINKKQTDESLNKLIVELDFQGNLYFGNAYGFMGVNYERQKEEDLNYDKTETGGGGGLKADKLMGGSVVDAAIQVGVYSRSIYVDSDFDRQFLSIISGWFTYPLGDRVDLTEDAAIILDVEDIDNYETRSITVLVLDLTEKAYLSAEADIQYTHNPAPGLEKLAGDLTGKVGFRF